ncbi:MAG: tRNA dihydrouridine synthase DusB [Candidatus Magasanikbacteria bacterium]|nr:tRNA dihydrouridine synthase DusB [Candidatus Magasanikbacteria bacterium]
MIDWKSYKKPIVALAPMADMSDLPFCLVSKEVGVSLMFREMVSSEAIIRLNPKTLKMAMFDERERPLVQQIFGANPEVMAEAARIIYERFEPDAIDINMGCPVYNLVSNFNGAALIKEPERAAAIVKAMKAAVPCPVSVKTRLGWVKDTDCLEFVKVVADAGADLISMHGRTREQGYAGTANWQRVGEARANVAHLPFLVNGDITSVESAKEAMTQSGADGVLIGRGLLGNPWFAKQVEAYLEDGSRIEPPTLEQRIEVIRRHAKLQLEHYGDHGLTKLRKHLPWYFKYDPKFKPLKEKLVRISSLEELEAIFEQARGL